MKNIELQEILKKYPNDASVKLFTNSTINKGHLKDFDSDHIMTMPQTIVVDEDTKKLKARTIERMIIINPPMQ